VNRTTRLVEFALRTPLEIQKGERIPRPIFSP
jgi:hypothetical protein